MSHDQLRLPGPPTDLPSAEERVRMYDDLQSRLASRVAAERRSARRRDRVAGVALPALVASCVLAVGGLVAVIATTPERSPLDDSRPVVATGPAVRALETAAASVTDRAVPVPDDDEFVYVRSRVVTNEGAVGEAVRLGPTSDREIWLSQEPGGTHDQGLIRDMGQDWPIWGAVGSPEGIRRPTYAYLASLPTDPDDLLDELTSQLPPWDDARTRDQVLFDEMVGLMDEGLAPPDTTAAFYRALTRIPGVRTDATARDLLGRPGVGITRYDGTYQTRDVLVVSPRTGEVLGARSLVGPPGREAVYGESAIVSRGITDSLGERPAELLRAPGGGSAAPGSSA